MLCEAPAGARLAVVSAMQNSNYFLLIAGKNHVTRLSLRHVCPMEEPMPRSVLLGCPKICAFLRPLVAITLEHPPERHFGLPDFPNCPKQFRVSFLPTTELRAAMTILLCDAKYLGPTASLS